MNEPSQSVLVRHLAPKNFLSFGPDFGGIELLPLNVLIGPNGSGKSNLIEAISLMRASVKEWRDVTRKGGGVAEWIWKGDPKGGALVEWILRKAPRQPMSLRHLVSFSAVSQSFELLDERIENELPMNEETDVFFFYRFQKGHPVINKQEVDVPGKRHLARDTIDFDKSILAQRREPEVYPELAWLAHNYEKIRIYREWSFGRNAVFRDPGQADMRNEILEEDFSNLGLFLSRLRKTPKAKKAIIDNLKKLYDGLTDFDVVVEGGTVQVFFTEGDFVIPATRLSDGTLRFLCLLAILCDPEPPRLICIEEPELGLHPDILPTLADLLKSASEKTQLIVTTHSDILVDALTDTPESVVVCTKENGRTIMERLSREALEPWLDRYRLGQLWTKGEIGGTRW